MAKGFVENARKVYSPLGFQKGYNFVLFFIFGGALIGFVLARLQYLNIDGVFCNRKGSGGNTAAPGECLYYSGGHYRVGIILHLGCVLPSMFLAVFQFVPVIRHKAILFHRINGYTVVGLALLSNAGALMIARIAFGGTLDTQVGVGVVAIMSTVGFAMAYYNIKRLQIDQHRAWMLRSLFYMSSIVTLRLILASSAAIIALTRAYYFAVPCKKIDFIFGGPPDSRDKVLQSYPDCASYYSGANPNQHSSVHASFGNTVVKDPAQVAASVDMSFGMALWLALWLHAVGIEIYLRLTPREASRLRQVSYERQLTAGFKNPGNAGLTVQKFGDADPWIPRPTEDK